MMNKKILVSIFFIGLLALALGWGTYSYFNDTETSTDNTFTAGTLDLKVDGADDSLPVYFSVSNVKPTDSDSKTIKLKNDGTIQGKAYIHIKNVANVEGANPEPETDKVDPGDLGQYLQIQIKYDGVIKVAWTSIDSLNSVKNELGILGGGAEKDAEILWKIEGTVGNDIMGDIVTFDIEFILEQA